MLKTKGNKKTKTQKDGEKTFSRMQRRMNQEALNWLKRKYGSVRFGVT